MKTTTIVVLAFATVLLVSAPAFAWGNDGHRIICEIAFQRLTPEGKALVAAIRADLAHVRDPFDDCPACQARHPDDGRQMSFSFGCTWPDESRTDTFKGTYEYHFVNVPKGSASVDLARDCAALDCVVAGIQRYARYVALAPDVDSGREHERRVLGLRFLGHFVGDLHQPLHVGFAEDAGGNDITVRWNTGAAVQTRKLHSVWDSGILTRAGFTNPSADALAMNSEITPAELAAWQTFDVAGWAEESFSLATTRAYEQPDGAPVVNDTLLPDAYFEAARPVVIEQIKKAGVRLAHLINAAAAGTLPANMVRLAGHP